MSLPAPEGDRPSGLRSLSQIDRTTPMAGPQTRTALLVTGMHRSGTSALARTLSLLGAELPEELVPPNAGNPHGHWEPSAMVALNDRMLADARSDLYSAVDIDPAWFASPAAQAFTDEAEQVAGQAFRGDLMVLKDPRTALLAPVWNEALARCGYRVTHVLPLRHPADVAESLRRRHLKDFPYDAWASPRGEAVWLRYTLAALRGAHGHGRVMVRYDDLLADWRGTVRHIGTALGIAWPRPDDEAAVAIGGFLHDNDLAAGQHPAILARDRFDALPVADLAAALYDRLCRDDGADVDAIAASFASRTGGVRDLLVSFEDLYPIVWRFFEDGRVAGERLDAAVAAESGLRASVQRHWAALTQANSDKLALQQTLASHDARLASFATELARHEAEAGGARARADAAETDAQRYAGDLDRLRAEARRAVEVAEGRVAAMERSTSWRLTAPLRAVARRLLGRA